jgi:hypothetical protein
MMPDRAIAARPARRRYPHRVPYVPDAIGAAALVAHFDSADPWQMSFGERTAMIGLLHALAPKLSVEIGTAQGGSLRRIAAVSEEVHSFDLVEPQPHVIEGLDNVTLHTGDSHALLPAKLAELEAAGRNVDFAMVDGDHSAAGVADDMRDLLNSDAVRRTVIVMHDSINEEVRRGLEAVEYDLWPKVQHVELDWVPGHVYRDPLEGELWGGLALVVVDADNPRRPGTSAMQRTYHSCTAVAAGARDADARAAELQQHLDRARRAVADITASPSWKLTAPLRALKRRTGR